MDCGYRFWRCWVCRYRYLRFHVSALHGGLSLPAHRYSGSVTYFQYVFEDVCLVSLFFSIILDFPLFLLFRLPLFCHSVDCPLPTPYPRTLELSVSNSAAPLLSPGPQSPFIGDVRASSCAAVLSTPGRPASESSSPGSSPLSNKPN